MCQIDKEQAARNAADEIDALLAQRLTPSAYLGQTPAIQEVAAIISRHFPSAVPVEEQKVPEWSVEHPDREREYWANLGKED